MSRYEGPVMSIVTTVDLCVQKLEWPFTYMYILMPTVPWSVDCARKAKGQVS